MVSLRGTDQQVKELADTVLILSESVKAINANLIQIADSCNTLSKKIVILEDDLQSRRVIAIIKKVLWGLYPVVVLALLTVTNIQHSQLIEMISYIKQILDI